MRRRPRSKRTVTLCPYTARVRSSALPPTAPRAPSSRRFQVCVAGHLRDEKDPLRAAFAARLAPPESRLRVVQLGKAHTADWARAAERSEEHTSELQALMRISYAVFCLKKKHTTPTSEYQLH